MVRAKELARWGWPRTQRCCAVLPALVWSSARGSPGARSLAAFPARTAAATVLRALPSCLPRRLKPLRNLLSLQLHAREIRGSLPPALFRCLNRLQHLAISGAGHAAGAWRGKHSAHFVVTGNHVPFLWSSPGCCDMRPGHSIPD